MKKTTTKKNWGFDTTTLNHSIRPQDDFFEFANGLWIQKNNIPLEESRWGSFNILRHNTDLQLKKILTTLTKKKSALKGSHAQLVRDMYLSAIDTKRRDTLDILPLKPYLKEIEAISSKETLLCYIARSHKHGSGTPWYFILDQDTKKSDQYLFTLWQGGLGMPEREYYLKKEPEQIRVQMAYKAHIKKLLSLSGFSSKEIAGASVIIMAIETALARAAMKKEDTREAEKTYHKYSIAQLERTIPGIAWRKYFTLVGAGHIKEVNVGQPEFFTAVSKLFATMSLKDWKIYLTWQLINGCAPLLSERFVRESFQFYGKTLTGSKQMKPLWRRALGFVNGAIGEGIGKLYVETYFTPEAKKSMDTLVSDLFAVYKERIERLPWMSSKTKQHAISKLHAMKRKIGYPTRFETYKGLRITPTDFFGNTIRTSEFEHTKAMKKSKRPVDRKEWFMTPQTVNAYYHPNLNEIAFPAAILQFPFFSTEVDDAINYGAIGSVIGHEITHGFDDQGSKFDAKGNLKSWWNVKDTSYFTKKGKALVAQFNAYHVTPEITVNGQLTLGENIADLGGLVIGYEAYQKHLKKIGRYDIEGFTTEQRFFLGFAQVEREIARPEFRKMQIFIDPHSPPFARVNGPVSNFLPFYTTFNVRKGDKLYRNPKHRVEIW